MAPWWSWSPAEGGRGEDGAYQEGGGCDLGFQGEDRSPPSQASAWSWASSGLEDEGGLMAKVKGNRLHQLSGLIDAERISPLVAPSSLRRADLPTNALTVVG